MVDHLAKLKRCSIAVLLILGAGSTFASIPEVDQAGNPLECDISGWFNPGWGVAIVIPAGLRGCNLEFHDTIIPLGSPEEDRWIMSSGSYNGTCETDLSKIVTEVLSGDEYRYQRLVKREKTRLAGLDAEHIVLRYKTPVGTEMMFEEVTAFTGAGESTICEGVAKYEYFLSLHTPIASYKRDKKTFDLVLKSSVIAVGGG